MGVVGQNGVKSKKARDDDLVCPRILMSSQALTDVINRSPRMTDCRCLREIFKVVLVILQYVLTSSPPTPNEVCGEK